MSLEKAREKSPRKNRLLIINKKYQVCKTKHAHEKKIFRKTKIIGEEGTMSSKQLNEDNNPFIFHFLL